MIFQTKLEKITEYYTSALLHAEAHDEQSLLESLYHLREIAWDINSDILAQRWAQYEAARPRRQPIIRTVTTVDDLMA